METTYIWASGGFVRILAHLASEHLLRGILCDKLGHDCGVVGVQVRNAQRFAGKGFLAMDTSVKETCRKTLYVQFLWLLWVLWRCVDNALRGGCLIKSARKLVGRRLLSQKF